ncbi:1,6-anhydro-N-acetylmuramyl-L-alanine amidase AmpD [Oceanimonas marisflavi]|uniref:1,6-anhydro-N-acetylmuramyl-L-alanine amidase AmpD n=1 Tax=Oceanimonas marisflavi TaxID=2059724 RepID=UPI000D31C758|nr:1,6-anhydro-N-acetylmuramyl-L-alanine amidase AmpD [Oceanimonas marisflavi]
MPFTLQEGWLSPARHCESPHQDDRPDADISLLVVHCISLPPGRFGGPYIDDLFMGRLDSSAHPYFEGIYQLRVSAHCLIRRDGELVQYVPFHRRAWHAGLSCFEGRDKCNDFSVGIELEGTDTGDYTPAQYRVLAEVTRALMQAYPAITPSRITGHSDIAPGRKTDPGPGFDWTRFRALL